MKAKIFSSLLILSLLLFTGFSFAEVNKPNIKANTYETIELNRLIGLASDNEGLRVSCAFNLGEMKSEKAVIPLMQLLREGKTLEERVIAALSLVKIGNTQGVYLVSRLAKFSECEEIASRDGEIVVPMNCGQELYDVIAITDESAGLTNAQRRVLGLSMRYAAGGKAPAYEQRLSLGAV